MSVLNDLDDVDLLARTLYCEARGEELSSLEAVAQALINNIYGAGVFVARTDRANGSPLVGRNARNPDHKIVQLSCWRKKGFDQDKALRINRRDFAFRLCRRMVIRVISGCAGDVVQGATRFHRHDTDPEWIKGLIPVAEVGNFLFYK